MIFIYRPMEGRRLSWPRHCGKCALCRQPMPKAVNHSGFYDKHNCLQHDSIPRPCALLDHCNLVKCPIKKQYRPFLFAVTSNMSSTTAHVTQDLVGYYCLCFSKVTQTTTTTKYSYLPLMTGMASEWPDRTYTEICNSKTCWKAEERNKHHNMPPPRASGDTIYIMHAYGSVTSCMSTLAWLEQPTKAAWWPWPFDLESGVRVTCDMGYHCVNF